MTQKIIQLPQRISPPSRPGERLKRPMESYRRVRLRETLSRDPVYLALVRECPCLYCGMDPCGEAAHLRMASGAHGKASGTGKTPDDRWALPVCGEHHRLARTSQHERSEREFWGELGIDPFQVAEALYAVRGDLVAMRAVVFYAIGRRGLAAVAGDERR